MIRITNLAQHVRTQNTVLNTQMQLFKSQTQIASGKVAEQYVEISADSSQLLSLKTELSRTQRFVETANTVERRLELMESSLSAMTDVASSLQTLLVQATSDSGGDDVPLKEEAEGMLQIVASQLNTQEDGRYLFAGSKTDTAAVQVPVPDPTTFGIPEDNYYQGDDLELSARLDEELTLSYGMTADREGFQLLIGALKAAIRGDTIDSDAMKTTALDLVGQAIDKLTDYSSEIGTNLSLVDTVRNQHEDLVTVLENNIGEIENTDIPKTVSLMSQQETLLEASYMTIARLGQLSLADYLK